MTEILDIFHKFKTILCICPHCTQLMRLSDLHLRAKTPSPKTWLDERDVKILELQKLEDTFAEKEDEIRKKSVERGRAQVPKIIKKSMNKQFAKLNYDPYDIKPILHPVDFIVYNGMNADNLKDVTFLARITDNDYLKKLHSSIKKAVDAKNYEWSVARVAYDGGISFE